MLQDASLEAHLGLASWRLLRESAGLDHWGLDRKGERVVGLTSIQILAD